MRLLPKSSVLSFAIRQPEEITGYQEHLPTRFCSVRKISDLNTNTQAHVKSDRLVHPWRLWELCCSFSHLIGRAIFTFLPGHWVKWKLEDPFKNK